MNDELRTLIQEFLIDSCGVLESTSEKLTEDLGKYLSDRGYKIVDCTAKM